MSSSLKRVQSVKKTLSSDDTNDRDELSVFGLKARKQLTPTANAIDFKSLIHQDLLNNVSIFILQYALLKRQILRNSTNSARRTTNVHFFRPPPKVLFPNGPIFALLQ